MVGRSGSRVNSVPKAARVFLADAKSPLQHTFTTYLSQRPMCLAFKAPSLAEHKRTLEIESLFIFMVFASVVSGLCRMAATTTSSFHY